MKIPGKIPIGTIQKKLPTLNSEQISLLNKSISLSPESVVAIDTKKVASPIVEKTFSIRLNKWVEPYVISGVSYSLFYTEVDHNFKVGDRVFIEGGVYDTDSYIGTNKYKKGVDGYRVLYVDRCKIVLDIKYTGQYPTNEEPIDNFIKVYVANNQEEFEYFSQTLTMRKDSDIIDSKFRIGFNNFLYLNGTFSISPGTFNNLQYFEDSQTLLTSITASNSFVVRDSLNPSTDLYWIINDSIINNTFQSFLNTQYASQSSIFYNNQKIRVMNGNFTFNDIEFKNEYVYYFDTIENIWKIDKSYLPTIITEQHFKRGKFKSGNFNQGLLGQHEDRIKWNGTETKWNLGSTLNVDWENGVLDSTIFKDDSNFTIFDRFDLPQIRANSSNNGGSGYNYIFNTNFTGGDIINGNIFNMAVKLGTNSSTQSVLENYITNNQTINYSININGGVYYNSEILFASVSNSTIISSYAFNSIFNKVKSVNSEIENSVFLNGTWISDKIVKIQSYEESNVVWYDENSQVNYKMYKFYINETNWIRLREFQNFYFQDLVINIPSNEILNFFDDKFSVGKYIRSFDDITGKLTQSVFVQLSTKEENRNSPGSISSGGTVSLQPNDTNLPSIDIFIQGGPDFDYGTSSSYPRPFISNTIDVTKAYILDSDFVSGLFKDSRWVSGNYINYNADYSLLSFSASNSGYVTSFATQSNEITFYSFYPKYRKDILGTFSNTQNITWINGLYYDSTLNGGNNIVKLSDTYKINRIGTFSAFSVPGRQFSLQDLFTQSGNSSLTTWNNQQYVRTINAQNRWNYLHPVKFENSIINSGIFRRAYFKNCNLTNDEFDLTDRELTNVENKRKLLLSDILFTDNNNIINSGLIQYSHFIGGSDKWQNGIFHQGIWNTSTFTYSFSTSSTIYYNSGGNTFQNGIFRNSRWIDGTFDNGLFYKNNTNLPGTNSIFIDTLQSYYIDNPDPTYFQKTRFSWQKGEFKNGDFEKSNFEDGTFINGNFYDSNFLRGESIGGNFGKLNLDYSKTRVYTGTFSNVNVINAEFRTENPLGGIPTLSSTNISSIYWKNGVFNKGIFGVKMIGLYLPLYPYFAIWENGIFNGGEFTDISIWKNGTFNDGKFTSRYPIYDTIVNLSPRFFRGLTNSNNWAWQSGKFNGGEFGTGQTGSFNSTWFDGEFNGGKFKGKYWKNGIFTRGQFNGSSTYSTDSNKVDTQSNITNYIEFYKSFNNNFYGYWENGFVTKNKDKFIKDEKIWTEVQRNSTQKRKNPETVFQNMFWNFGTFSNFDAQMNNSIWINGSFQDGYFSNSSFNPYINLNKLPSVGGTKGGIKFFNTPSSNQQFTESNDIYQYSFSSPGSNTILHTNALVVGETYTVKFEVLNNTGVIIAINGAVLFASTFAGFVNYTFTTGSVNLTVQYSSLSSGLITHSTINIFPGTQSGFRITDDCIWENGISYSSDINFSKWKQGIFDSYATSSQGNSWGVIWKDGIAKYMNAYNVYWEKGIWKNGNWNGSPFNQVNPPTIKSTSVQNGFASDIITNIYIYASQSFANDPNNLVSIHDNYDLMHMNDSFTGSNYSNFNNEDVSDIFTYAFVNNIGDTILLPGNLSYQSNSGIRTRFGNGQFLSGIWENGVWNEGWRQDLTTIWSDGLTNFSGGKSFAYKEDVWTWKFQLNILDISNTSSSSNISSISLYNKGDKVSIGNLVAIDINGNRRLFRGTFDVVDIQNQNSKITMDLSVNINFPIRSIEKDSNEHLIYITKNIWLNGIFLNGYFSSGVWNNGLFRGFPYITKMENSHWIDGVFKGGHFKGLTGSYTYNNNTIEIHKSVIQKFDFYDENVSNQPYQFKYNSWIDVNYYKTEGVNINRINNVYKPTSLGFTTSFSENNFYGYPTMDVLESNSTLRNGFDLNQRTYKLGWKWKEYTNSLIEVGEFIDINQLTYNNSSSNTSGIGINNLLNDGWTFSYLTPAEGFAPATNSIFSNIGNLESEWLYISGGRNTNQVFPLSDSVNFTVDIFNNTNINIEKQRYSFIEIEAENLNFTQSVSGIAQPVVFYNNYPATYSIAAVNTIFNGKNITIPVNQISKQSVVNQREYFFNKNNLEMIIFSGPTYSLRFKKIRFVETDMIPFTQIADDCIQFKTNALWETTPPVNFPTTSNTTPFTTPYPGQWELLLPEGQLSTNGYTGNLQLIEGQGLPTWDNLYLVFGGAGCASYINEDIETPYQSKSPDISSDLDIKPLISENIILLENPIVQV